MQTQPVENRQARRTRETLDRRGIDPTEVLTVTEAAEYVRLSKPTLDRMRVQGGGPKFAKLTSLGSRGGAVRYRRADLDAWLESKIVSSTSEAA